MPRAGGVAVVIARDPTLPFGYLLVSQPNSSARVALPYHGTLRIGRSPSAHLFLDLPGLAEAHAQLDIEAGQIKVRAYAEMSINGAPMRGPRLLTSGDVLALGAVTIALHTDGPAHVGARLLAFADLRDRLSQEVERALRTKRGLAVLAVAFTGPLDAEDAASVAISRALRFEDIVGHGGQDAFFIVLPDTDENARVPCTRLLDRLATPAGEVRIGLALCPADARTADDLLTGARMAASHAGAGTIAEVANSARFVEVGAQRAVAVDPKTAIVFDLVRRLAPSDLPVLVEGETGVGKEVIAQALHLWSRRAGRPLVAINCAALTETLFESELFGHERGAFTGATATKLGQLELAAGGTVFLDEIGECSAAAQAKLLRVIETHRLNRLGGVAEIEVDVRVVAATNRDLAAEVEAGRFRRDLLYRLNAALVHVPPLRERALDMPVLARTFLSEACQRAERTPLSLSRAAQQQLSLHDWPGNIRELKNLMDYLAATVDGDVVDAFHLPDQVARAAAPWQRVSTAPCGAMSTVGPATPSSPAATFRPIAEEIAQLEERRMRQALEATDGVRVDAAALIEMPLRTFVARLKKYGITTPSSRKRNRG